VPLIQRASNEYQIRQWRNFFAAAPHPYTRTSALLYSKSFYGCTSPGGGNGGAGPLKAKSATTRPGGLISATKNATVIDVWGCALTGVRRRGQSDLASA